MISYLMIKKLKRQLLEKDKLIEQLENKPETNGFDNRISGDIYLVHDEDKPGHYNLGFATKPNSTIISDKICQIISS